MIQLYAPKGNWGVLNSSPFCMKLELYVMHAKIPYEKVTDFNFAKAPRGKIPYISDEGTLVTDSSNIIEYLNKKHGITLDDHLSPEQKAIGYSIQRMVEDGLYWCMVYERWAVDKNWEITKQAFFGGMPKPLYLVVPNMVRKKILRDMKGQGTGKRDRDEIHALAIKDIESITTILGKKNYLFGETLSYADIIVYSTLANLMYMPHESKISKHIQSNELLVSYVKRMDEVFG